MKQKIEFFYKNIQNPVFQAALAATMCCLFILGSKAMQLDKSPENAWITAGAFIFVFILFNAVLALNSSNIGRYQLLSIISYALLVAFNGAIATFASGQSINETGSIRSIIMMLTFGYLLLLNIMSAIRWFIKKIETEEEETKLRQTKK